MVGALLPHLIDQFHNIHINRLPTPPGQDRLLMALDLFEARKISLQVGSLLLLPLLQLLHSHVAWHSNLLLLPLL